MHAPDHPAGTAKPRRRPARRLVALVAMLLAAVLALAACGSSGTQDGGGASADAADTASDDGTHTVTDATGTDVEVPNDPQRVVTLSELDLDSALAVDVTPVGTTAARGQDGPPRYLGEQADDIDIVGTVSGPQLGKVIKARPDLILAGQVRDEQVLDKLRDIAPTVVTFNLGDSWEDGFAAAAEALNRTDAQEQVMDEYADKTDAVREALGTNSDDVVSVVRWTPKGPATINQGTFVSNVLADLGLKRPAGQMEHSVHSMPLSMENLGQIDADWIFLGTLSGQGDAVEALDEAESNPAFTALSAVQDGHVVTVDGSEWMSLGGPIAAMNVLGDVQKAMAQ